MTLKLIPGVDQNKTPALNEVAISFCDKIRFMPDRQGIALPQKLGGWKKFLAAPYPGIPRSIWAWEDANTKPHLTVGTTTDLITSSNGGTFNLSPQYYSKFMKPDFTTTKDSPKVSINSPGSNVKLGDTIDIRTPISVGGLILFGQYQAEPSGPDTFTITARDVLGFPLNATSTVINGGVVPQFTVTNNSASITVTFPKHGYAAGRFFPILTPTVIGGITLYGNYIVQQSGLTQDSFTIIADKAANASQSVFENNGDVEIIYYIGGNTTSSTLGYGVGGYGVGGYGVGSQISSGHTSPVTNVIGGSPMAGYVTYFINEQINIPVGSEFTVTGINPPAYNSSPNRLTVVNTYPGGGSSPVTISIGSPAVITWPNSGLVSGDIVSFSTDGTLPTGITAGTDYYVERIDANTFNISSTMGGPPITTSGTQSGTHIAKRKTTSIVVASPATGTYVSGGTITFEKYGSHATTDWSLGNWGDVLISNPVGGGIFKWTPGTGIFSSSPISNAPNVNDGMFIAMPQRQIVAWGSTFSGIQEPLLVRWCDVNNFNVWVADVANQAGSYTIPRGSKIVGGIQAAHQGLLWTDLGVWAMQYTGQPYVYSFNEIGSNCGLIARRAAGTSNDIVYWMGNDQFYMLGSNSVAPLACPIWDIVFQNLNTAYLNNIRFAANSLFNEVAWHYPSVNSINGENDSYVKYNTAIQAWDYGTLNRTAWIDQSIHGPPLGTSSAGYVYQHETSQDDDTQPMLSSFRTGYFQMSEAEAKVFVDQIWPDMKWGLKSGSQSAIVKITFYATDYPGIPPNVYGPFSVTQSTKFVTPRFRARLVSLEISSDDLASFWRLGAVRYRMAPDGKF